MLFDEFDQNVIVAVVELDPEILSVGYKKDDKYYFIKVGVTPREAIDLMADAVDAGRYHNETGKPQKGVIVRDIPEPMKPKEN